MTPSRALGRLASALLKGAAVDEAVRDLEGGSSAESAESAPERIVERDDVDAALLLAWRRTLARRIDDAKGRDAVDVIVADGSAYDVATAEKQLAQKEEARVYPPLRSAIAKAIAPFQRFGDRRSEWRRALVLPEPAASLDAVKALAEFLTSTTSEVEAAKDVLRSAGGADLDGSAAYARGVDLPDVSLFSELHVAGLMKQALAALPRRARPVVKSNAPRALAGVVVEDDDAVRLWSAPSFTAGRFRALTTGAARALALSAQAPAFAPGLSFALVDAEFRKKALDDSKAAAAKAFRISAATAFLDARERAAAAVVVVKGLDDEEEREVVRDAVRAAVGVDVGDIAAVARLLAPLPDGSVVNGAAAAVVDDATAAVSVAAGYLDLRAFLDVGFLLRPRALEVLRELPPPSAAGASTSKELSRGWTLLLGELL